MEKHETPGGAGELNPGGFVATLDSGARSVVA